MIVGEQLHENYDVDATCQSSLQVVTMLRKNLGLPRLSILMLLDAERAMKMCATQ